MYFRACYGILRKPRGERKKMISGQLVLALHHPHPHTSTGFGSLPRQTRRDRSALYSSGRKGIALVILTKEDIRYSFYQDETMHGLLCQNLGAEFNMTAIDRDSILDHIRKSFNFSLRPMISETGTNIIYIIIIIQVLVFTKIHAISNSLFFLILELGN